MTTATSRIHPYRRKLEQVLKLPPSIEIQKAKVLSLRVTVPAAIHSNPISIEADGVEIKLRIVPPEEQKGARRGVSKHKDSRNSPGPERDDLAPHAIDLAQSFLETQPRREKEELQAALNAEAPDLAASVTSSEDGSEDEYGPGTGQPLSLPTFLATFIQGIVDRLQLSIRSVACQLDVELPSTEVGSSLNEIVTFQLAIDEINAEGVTTTRIEDGDSDVTSTPFHKEGKRYVELNKIRASLISEANLFSALSRSSSMPSSVGAASPVAMSRQPLSQETSFIPMAIPPLDGHLADSTDLSDSQYHPLMDSEDAFNIPYDLSNSGDDPEDDENRSTPSTPRASTSRSPIQSSPRALPPLRPAFSTMATRQDPWIDPAEPSARSEHMLDRLSRWGAASTDSVNDDKELDNSSNRGDKLLTSTTQSLAQSHVFSHEEAESMYMSAFSHTASSQMRQTMPGTWDGDYASAENPLEPRATGYLDSSAVVNNIISNEQLPPVGQSVLEAEAIVDNLHEAVSTPNDLLDEVPGIVGLQKSSSPRIRDSLADDVMAEEAATPKGPTRLVKELVSSNAVHLWYPSKPPEPISTSESSNDRPRPSHLDYSTVGHVPGSFSIHSAAAHSVSSIQDFTPPPSKARGNTHSSVDDSLEVVVSPLEVKFDLSTAFLLTTVINRILGALKEPNGQSKPATTAPSSLPDIKIVVEKISIHFLEILSGVADTPERILGARPVTFDADALLTTTLENLVVRMSQSQSSTTTSVNIGKFKFGYANDDIVSFDQRIQMRSSVRDAFPSAGSDISLTIVQSSHSTRCEVKTLPLHVKLDLPRLDETFTWFGGLSGFLNLNSSTNVNTPPITQSPAKLPQRPRGVRFDAPIRPDDASVNSENKINMRIGGVRLDLLGKECSVSLDASAVKLVNREEGLGVGISKVQLTGPYMKQLMGDPPVNAIITNTRIEFLNTPKDNDLERLLGLITPSKNKFDKDDDEIMVDTLLRQRRKGAVLRVNVDDIDISVENMEQLHVLPTLGEDIARLSTVTKYLPEDDRPGFLTLALVRNIDASVTADGKIGVIQASFKELEAGHITMPSLVAVGLGAISLRRNHSEQLVSSIPPLGKGNDGPVVTMRLIGDEMDPVVKLRMRYLDVEYRVPTIMDFLDLGEDATPQDFESSLAASVANLGGQAHAAIARKPKAHSINEQDEQIKGKPTKVDIILHDCLLGLNPLGLTSKMVIALTNTHFEVALTKGNDANMLGHFNKASILLIDDVSAIGSKSPPAMSRRRSSSTATPQVVELCQQGFVDVCYISSAKILVQTGANQEDGTKWVDIEVRDDLLVLETCADSTQTLIALANALAPPTPPKKEIKYRTNVVPMQDLLASISADAFGTAEGDYNFDDDFLAHGLGDEDDDSSFDLGGSDYSAPLELDSQFYDDPATQELLLDHADSVISDKTTARDTTDGVLLTNFSSQPEDLDEEDDLVIHENYFSSGSVIEGTAHRWNSTNNAYDQSNDAKVHKSPLSVRVRDVHFIWNLFDGYDWNHTRDVISKAVYDIETTAIERQSRQDRARAGIDMEIIDEETVIGDFLFNSIYIGIPANRDPRELAQAINQELNDNATETESIATTAMTATPSRQGGAYRTKKKLKLNRSKRHKITFELKGINVDLVAFPPGSGETQSSIDVRVKDLVVFDHVPTSTWKKFVTYDQDAGEREMDASMVHLEILNVKPLPELAAAEIVLKATVLPLRLHVDQDALDFITRFFEFKDDSKPAHASPSDIPFIQRAEVNSIPVTLDFKPKRVDYAGLRSGHTTEFMNFVVLDQSRLILRRTIVYGALGFDRLGQTLNDTWMPDVKRNQLPGVLAGLAPVRSLVNVGSGFKDLIEIPIREYKKDGRIVRSISKGAAAFAKTTGTELVKLGAKLAVGTQYALQGAEGILTKQHQAHESTGWEDEDTESEETKQISLYADQPTGVVQGLRGAYSSLARDLNLARDAIIAVPGEVMESGNAQGAAKAVLKRAPTIIFRPLIGSSKAIGQTLMGATNSLDPQNRRRVDEKYKKH
ncbi:putative autophagy-related protein 2 [Rosellinia necatrix]|uniref:Autophagy-related protein 2 n=1 Tax=Rosellinia necatrix TaxID=77044 RepID=A0A1S7UJB2_ROSNE|nr:putative autophagy-related protein 2 [Rosellinia necatrix]